MRPATIWKRQNGWRTDEGKISFQDVDRLPSPDRIQQTIGIHIQANILPTSYTTVFCQESCSGWGFGHSSPFRPHGAFTSSSQWIVMTLEETKLSKEYKHVKLLPSFHFKIHTAEGFVPFSFFCKPAVSWERRVSATLPSASEKQEYMGWESCLQSEVWEWMHVPIPTQDGEEDTNLSLVSESSGKGLTEPFLVCYILSSKEFCHAPVGSGRGWKRKGDEGTKWHGEHYALRDSAFFQWYYYFLLRHSERGREGLEILQGQQVNQQISGKLWWLRAKYGMSLSCLQGNKSIAH